MIKMPNGQTVTIGPPVHLPLFIGVSVDLVVTDNGTFKDNGYVIFPGGIRTFTVEEWAEIRGKRVWQIREQCRAIVARKTKSWRRGAKWLRLDTLSRQLFGHEGRAIAARWRTL